MRDDCGRIEGFGAKLHGRLLCYTAIIVGETDSS